MPQLLPAAAAWATAAWSSAVTATAVGLTKVGVMAALGEGATIALAGKIVATTAAFGLSAAAAALMRPNTPSSGTTLDFKPDPKAPIRGAMGYTALGGNKVFQATWGYKRVAMSLGVALSLGPIDQVPRFEADGATVTFSGPQSEATGFYAADMWQRTTLGLPGDAALLPPTGLKYGNPGLTGWGTQHAAPQVSFSFWTMVLAKNPEDRDVFTNGVPDPRWIGRWMKLWDPRKDSTYPGGSGSQRRDDWRTWGWSENPYVHALAWVRGHYRLNLDGTIDRSKRIAGVGAPDAAVDIPAFVEGMNVADANAWTISGEWSTSDGKFQTLLAMLQAGGGEPISRGAQISVMVNAPRVATYTYTRDDLIGQAEIRPLTPRRERKNTIVPRYKSEANGWQYVPAGEVTSSVYRDEDRGEPRSLEIEYTHVRSAKQAGQLAAYDLANLREGLTATLPSKVHLMHVHPGDCITVDVPELALAGQKFVVRRATMNHQAASVTLELRSESDGKHAWALGQAAQPAPSPSLSAVDPKYVPPPVPDDWTVVPKPPGDGGISQPIVIIELPIETTDIIAVIIKHGPSSAGPWTDGYEGSPRPDGRYEVAGLTPGQTYCFSLQYVAKNGAKSEPDIKCGIVAGDLVAGDTTHLNGEPVQDILDKLTDTATLTAANATAVADMGDRVEGVIAEAEGILAGAEGAAALAVLKAGEAGEAAEASNTAAGIATTKADEAGASAQAANAEKLAAQAARDTADQKAQASVLAAAQAEAFAGEAGDWAAASEGSAVQAAASAGEGLAYRNQAVDARDGAVAANISSGTSAKASSDQAAALLYNAFDSRETWTNTAAATGPISGIATTSYQIVNDPDLGPCLEVNSAAEATVSHKGYVYAVGRRHRIRIKAKCVTPGSGGVGIRDARLGAALNYITRGNIAQTVPSAGQIVEFDVEIDSGQRVSNTAGAQYIRWGLSVYGTWRLSLFSVEDVSESYSAANSAASALSQSSNASAAAASAQISANLAAQVGGRSRRVSDGTIFTSNLGGSPAGAPDLTAGVVLNDYLENAVREVASAINIQTKGVLEIGTGRTFRVYARTRVMVDGPNNTTYPHFRVLDASYASIGLTGPSRPQAAADMWQTYSHELTSEQIKAAYPTAFYIRGAVRVNRAGTTTGSSGATTRVAELWLEDLSELAPISAQLAIVGGVAADAADRLSTVRFDVTGGAGGDPFQIWGRAGPDGSVAGMVASELSFSTVVRGLVVKAMRLIGGDVFVINRLYVGPNKEIEIEPFTPAINWTMGAARLAIGKLANDNLLFWFGPNVTAANMRKSNAALWLDRAGGAYFGGALSAGTLTNKAATTSLSFGATTETARFNSHGGTITVTLSLSGGWNKGYWNDVSKPAATENGNVVVTLYRSVNGGAFSPVVTLPMTYNWSRETREFEPGLGWHVVEQGGYAGSLTYTDPQTSTQDRQYRATITTFSPITQTGIMTSQNLSIIAVE